MRKLLTVATAAALGVGLLATPAVAGTVAPTTGADVVISQVHGGGGNAGGIYASDFVVLFNRSDRAVSVDGMSLQYTSADGTNTFGSRVDTRTAVSGTIAPGGSLLVRGGNGSTTGLRPLPTPDVDPGTNLINLDQNAGRVALVTGTSGLGCNGASATCNETQLARIVDLVGYGAAAFFEGRAPAPRLTNASAAVRAGAGCTDTDDNAADFSLSEPAPRNSASPVVPCQPVRELQTEAAELEAELIAIVEQLEEVPSAPAAEQLIADLVTVEEELVTVVEELEVITAPAAPTSPATAAPAAPTTVPVAPAATDRHPGCNGIEVAVTKVTNGNAKKVLDTRHATWNCVQR